MIVVGAGASDGVHDCAGTVALSRAVVAGLNTEFLQGLRKGERQVFVLVEVGVTGTVQSKRHRALLRTVRGQPQGAGDRLAGFGADRPDHGARDQRRQFRRVAPVERQLDDARVVDDFADGGCCDVHLHRVPRDADCLTQFPKLEREVHAQVLVRQQFDTGAADASESGECRPDFIRGRPERGEGVKAVGARQGFARQAGRLLDSGHGGARHHAATAVGDDAVDLALLRQRRTRNETDEEDCKTYVPLHHTYLLRSSLDAKRYGTRARVRRGEWVAECRTETGPCPEKSELESCSKKRENRLV